MNIDVYTICRDEEELMPFFLAHYGPIARRIVLYDSDSKDRTREVARSCPKVEIRDCDDGGCLDEDWMLHVRNNAWRESDADWIVICDIDEFVYHPDLAGELGRLKAQGVTLPDVQGYEMVGKRGVPRYLGRPLTSYIFQGVPSKPYSKRAVFDPSQVDIRYYHGCHWCDPKGNVVTGGSLKLLHYHYLGEEYIVRRWAKSKTHVHPDAKERGWKLYDWPEDALRWQYGQFSEFAQPIPNSDQLLA